MTTSSAAVTSTPSTPTGGLPDRTHPTAANPDFATLAVFTKAASEGGTLNPRYTCQGADESPPLVWGAVPKGTEEIMVVARSLSDVHLTTDWVVAGIEPLRDHLAPGSLPAEAVVGQDSNGKIGYEVCPKGSGAPTTVIYAVFALPKKLGLKPGFNPRVLRTIVGNPEVPWGSAVTYAD